MCVSGKFYRLCDLSTDKEEGKERIEGGTKKVKKIINVLTPTEITRDVNLRPGYFFFRRGGRGG